MADTPKGACLCGGIVGADNLRVTKGADMISACTSEFAPRNFCSGCGSRIYDDLGEKYFVTAGLMRERLSGAFTVRDEALFTQLVQVLDATGERIEPSAAAGFGGPAMLTGSDSGRAWLAEQGLQQHLARATHLVWTTGGLFVPPDEYERFVQRGRALS